MADYVAILKELISVYATGGFIIYEICCDNEFRPIMDEMKIKFKINMNYANPQDHVLEAECNNHTIKE